MWTESERVNTKNGYPRPSLTADVVVVALDEAGALRVLVIQRRNEPFRGAWALPGGFCEPNETVAETAVRELEEEAGLSGVHVDELHSFSKPGRDPRGWVVTIAHLALVPAEKLAEAKGGDDAAEAAWLTLVIDRAGNYRLEKDGAEVKELAFDHADVIATAVARLRDDIEKLAFRLLPETFTAAKARRVFEAILGDALDPIAFEERIVHDGLVWVVGTGRAAFRRSSGPCAEWLFRDAM
jgi:8-oxo-dGTP diphosphatase